MYKKIDTVNMKFKSKVQGIVWSDEFKPYLNTNVKCYPIFNKGS